MFFNMIGANINIGRTLGGVGEGAPVVLPSAYARWLVENTSRHRLYPKVTAQLATSRSFYGGSSLRTTGNSYIEITNSAAWMDFPKGSEEFTYKGRISLDQGDGLRRMILGQLSASGATASANIWIEITTSNKLLCTFAYGASVVQLTSTTSFLATTDPAPANWPHFAFVRDVDTIRLYINGVQEASADVTGLSMNTSGSKFSIGRAGEFVGLYANAHYDLMEFDTGVCRYPDGTPFTPPTEPTTPDQYRVLSLALVGSNGSVRMPDDAKPAYGTETPVEYPLMQEKLLENDQEQPTLLLEALYDPDGKNGEPIIIPSLDATSDEYTSGFTVNNGFTYVVACKADTAVGTQALIGDGTNFIGFIGGAPACNFGTALTDTVDVSGTWGILAAVVDGISSKLYWNGVEVEAGATGSNNLGSAYHLSNNAKEFFVGSRGDEEVYDEVLTPSQVVARTNELKTKYGV